MPTEEAFITLRALGRVALTMDEKESGKQAKTKGDNLVWFIQDISMYLYRTSV